MPFLLLLRLFVATLRLASVATLASAAATDINRRIISNRTSLATFGFGALLRLMIAPHAFAASMLTAAAVYLGLAALAQLKFLGGGDVKLGAASTFFVPAGEVPMLLLDICVAGGVVCLFYLVIRAISHGTNETVPYGVAISSATAYRVIVDLWP